MLLSRSDEHAADMNRRKKKVHLVLPRIVKYLLTKHDRLIERVLMKQFRSLCSFNADNEELCTYFIKGYFYFSLSIFFFFV